MTNLTADGDESQDADEQLHGFESVGSILRRILPQLLAEQGTTEPLHQEASL